MRNPLRSEAEAYRFLGVVIVGAVLIIVAAVINKWLGVAVAVLVFVGLFRWLRREPVPGSADHAPLLASSTPPGTRRVLVLAPPGTESVTVPDDAALRVGVPTPRRPRRRSRRGFRARGWRSALTIRRSPWRTRCGCSAPTRCSWRAT